VAFIRGSLFHAHALDTAHSQKGISQRTPDNAHAGPHSLSSALLLETRVDLDQIQRNQTASLMHALSNEIALSERQTASHRSSSARRKPRVQRINVERQVNGRVRADPAERHVHDLADAVAVDVVHAERLDAVLAQDLLLAAVDVAQADVHDLLDADAVLVRDPAERRVGLVAREAGEEGDGHAVDVAAVGGLGGVDVGVRVDPDDGHVAAEALADGLGGAADGADCDAVVAAEGEDEAALFGVVVDLLAEGLSDGADGSGLLHTAVVWV